MAFNRGFFSSSYDLEKQRNVFEVPPVSKVAEYSKESKDDHTERGQWSKSIESLLLCLSMSVGLGNIWRFPNVAYNNGGGAFLIPYLILLCIIGRPLYYLELILGQFCSQGPIKLWRIVPALKGIGYAQIVSVSYVLIFYNYLMALSVFYIVASFNSCLPWTECNYPNGTLPMNETMKEGIPPSEYFWIKEVLQETDDDQLSISWQLVLCLFFTWTIVFLSVIQGTRSLGKMSYFTAIFPFFGLAALLIITCFEEGAFDGIKFFFQPDLEKLKDINVWYKATEQSFFSLTIAYGNIVMIASYNKFNHNIYRDAIIISVLDTFVNLLAGCVSFAVLGSLSHKFSKDINQVVNHEGLGLAFIVYPEALAAIKYAPQLWSVIFFFMLFVLGIGSSMSMIETLLTVLKDRFPVLRQKKWLLALGICSLFFVLGIPLTTNVGQSILLLLNNYGAGVAIFFYAVLEVIGVMWIYGLQNFCQDVEYMLNKPPGLFWKFTWAVAAPIALMVIFVFGILDAESKEKSSDPTWSTTTGWILASLALIQIPLWFIHSVYRSSSPTLWEKITSSLKPADNWGPSDPSYYADWKALKNAKKLKEMLLTRRKLLLKPVVDIESTVQTAYVNKSFKEDVF